MELAQLVNFSLGWNLVTVQIWNWVVDPHAGPGLGERLRFTGVFEEPEKYLTAYNL